MGLGSHLSFGRRASACCGGLILLAQIAWAQFSGWPLSDARLDSQFTGSPDDHVAQLYYAIEERVQTVYPDTSDPFGEDFAGGWRRAWFDGVEASSGLQVNPSGSTNQYRLPAEWVRILTGTNTVTGTINRMVGTNLVSIAYTNTYLTYTNVIVRGVQAYATNWGWATPHYRRAVEVSDIWLDQVFHGSGAAYHPASSAAQQYKPLSVIPPDATLSDLDTWFSTADTNGVYADQFPACQLGAFLAYVAQEDGILNDAVGYTNGFGLLTNGNAKWTVDLAREWDLAEYTGGGTSLRQHILPYTNASALRIKWSSQAHPTNAYVGYLYSYWQTGVVHTSSLQTVTTISSNWVDVVHPGIRSITQVSADDTDGSAVFQVYTTNDMVFSDAYPSLHRTAAIRQALNERYAVLTTPPYRYALDELMFSVTSTNTLRWTATRSELSTNWTGNLYADTLAQAATSVSVVADGSILPAGGRINVTWYSNAFSTNAWSAVVSVTAYGASNPFYQRGSFNGADEIASRETNWLARPAHAGASFTPFCRYLPVSTSIVYHTLGDALACPSNTFAHDLASSLTVGTNAIAFSSFAGGMSAFPTDYFPAFLTSLSEWNGTSNTNPGVTNLGYRIEIRTMMTPDYTWQ